MAGIGPGSGPEATFRIDTDADGTVRVAIGGELDLATIGHLQEEVARVLATPPPRMTVDVSDVRFADSSAIALWVRWAGAVPEFELREPPPLLRRVISTMGLSGKLGVTT